MITVVHIKEFAGPGQSFCGLRQIEITRAGEILVQLPRRADFDIRPGYEFCSDCMSHPLLALWLMRTVK